MEIFFTEPVPLLVETLAALAIAVIVVVGYRKNIFLSRFALVSMGIEVIYTVGFLAYKYFSGAITAGIAKEAHYALLASVHGIISLVAIIAMLVLFPRAYKHYSGGENFFKKHSVQSVTLVALWIIELGTGLFL